MTRKATALVVTESLPRREDLERQAAEVEAQLDAFRQQDMQREQEEQRRRAQAEQEYDRQQIATFSRAALDSEVANARTAFDVALADTPLVRALADYLTALQRRRTATYEHASVLTRLGLPGIAGHDLPPAELGPVEDLIAAAVRRIVTERTDADAAALAAQRETAITTATETRETP